MCNSVSFFRHWVVGIKNDSKFNNSKTKFKIPKIWWPKRKYKDKRSIFSSANRIGPYFLIIYFLPVLDSFFFFKLNYNLYFLKLRIILMLSPKSFKFNMHYSHHIAFGFKSICPCPTMRWPLNANSWSKTVCEEQLPVKMLFFFFFFFAFFPMNSLETLKMIKNDF